ncbi:hypothetical protein D3C81_1527130 [compost metagenome]
MIPVFHADVFRFFMKEGVDADDMYGSFWEIMIRIAKYKSCTWNIECWDLVGDIDNINIRQLR